MDAAVQDYIDGIAAEHRPLFERLHLLILATQPEATVVLSYGIPCYKVGRRRLFLGAWKHGLSVYGWRAGDDGGFVERHPELRTSKGTLQLTPTTAAAISDAELAELFRSTLG
jgi:uncharacterized protein YdhG (YjbR/CyaY superfamily)